MKFFQFTFAGPCRMTFYIAAPSMAIARIVARDKAPSFGYTLADLDNAVETHAADTQAAGHFLTSEGWKKFTEYGSLIYSDN